MMIMYAMLAEMLSTILSIEPTWVNLNHCLAFVTLVSAAGFSSAPASQQSASALYKKSKIKYKFLQAGMRIRHFLPRILSDLKLKWKKKNIHILGR